MVSRSRVGSSVGFSVVRSLGGELDSVLGPRHRGTFVTIVTELLVKDWRDQAACLGKDQSLWFPPMKPNGQIMRETPKYYRRAKAICDSCPVNAECLEWALNHPDDCCAMLGSKMAVERERLRRQRRRDARAAKVEFRRRENGVFEIE